MTKDEFIEKAKEYGYDDEGIKELLQVYKEMQELMPTATYDDIALIQQAVY